MTGLLPAKNGVRDNHGYRLNANDSYDGIFVPKNGYKTAAFVSSVVLDHRFGLN